jgi:hypothetical protein
MVNPFLVNQAVKPIGVRGSGYSNFSLLGDKRKAAADQAKSEESARMQRIMRDEFAIALDSPNPNDMAKFSVKYPGMSKIAQDAFGFASEQTKDVAKRSFGMAIAANNEEEAARYLLEGAEELRRMGANPINTTKTAQSLLNGEIDLLTLKKQVAMTDPDTWSNYQKFTESQKEGGADLPAEAIAFNDLIKDFSPAEKKLARRVKAGTKGRAISNAVMTGIEDGTIKSYSKALADIKQEGKFAEMTGSSRAKAIDKGFETITKIDAGVRNIDRAISELGRGAGVGVVEKMWPSIKAASVALDNIRSSMALDVVGATTFGALSAGELALAKDVALPTGLDTEELIIFLSDRKAAQQKLRNYYNEQIQFLDQGGTVAGFLRNKDAEQQAGAQQPVQGQPAATQQALSDEDLLKKYGG